MRVRSQPTATSCFLWSREFFYETKQELGGVTVLTRGSCWSILWPLRKGAFRHFASFDPVQIKASAGTCAAATAASVQQFEPQRRGPAQIREVLCLLINSGRSPVI